MELKRKKIILGVSGGIAAYKACELARRLQDGGAEVHVILTTSAQQFVTPLTFQSLTGHPVHTDLFNLTEESEMSHIKLADEADLVVIAPATADLIAKLAVGMANDLLTTVALVTRAPIFLAPSMNVNMWEKDVVQQNIRTLANRGYRVIDPAEGYLACGWEGKGRLAEPEQILKALSQDGGASPTLPSKKKSLAGKKILINAGPTREYLDPVRFISNPSSGKMGFALAEEAARRGAEVSLVTGPVALPTPANVRRRDVESAEEMLALCRSEFPAQDVFIASAAVGDYIPEKFSKQKLKKTGAHLQVKLKAGVDILKTLAAAKHNGQLVVGFAAETEQVVANAKKKLREKKLDLIVANEISEKNPGFAVTKNRVTLISKAAAPQKLPLLSKADIAAKILDWVEKNLA